MNFLHVYLELFDIAGTGFFYYMWLKYHNRYDLVMMWLYLALTIYQWWLVIKML